jgi:hypothetical protein
MRHEDRMAANARFAPKWEILGIFGKSVFDCGLRIAKKCGTRSRFADYTLSRRNGAIPHRAFHPKRGILGKNEENPLETELTSTLSLLRAHCLVLAGSSASGGPAATPGEVPARRRSRPTSALSGTWPGTRDSAFRQESFGTSGSP